MKSPPPTPPPPKTVFIYEIPRDKHKYALIGIFQEFSESFFNFSA